MGVLEVETPKKLFLRLLESDINFCLDNQNFCFDKKNDLKKFFACLFLKTKKRQLQDLKRLIDDNLSTIISQSRIRQFQIFWDMYIEICKRQVPNEIIKNVNSKINFFLHLELNDCINIHDLNAFIVSMPKALIYDERAIKIFKKHLLLSKKSASYLSKTADPILLKNILISIYALTINNEYKPEQVREMLPVFENSIFKNTIYKMCLNRSITSTNRNKPIKGVKSKKSKNKFLYQGVTRISNHEPFEKDKLLIKEDEISLSRKIEMLILNEDYTNGLEMINLASEQGIDNKKMTGYLIEILFRMNHLNEVRKLLLKYIRDEKKIDNRYYFLLVLKKILTKQSFNENSKSVAKLDRKMSE